MEYRIIDFSSNIVRNKYASNKPYLNFYRYKNKEVNVIRNDIAWPSDKKIKFSNPLECKEETNNTECLKDKFNKYVKPKYWKRNLWELDTINPDNNGLQNEDFIVWMRTAAFPYFRKPYRKINHTDSGNIALAKHFKDGIPKGSYFLIIAYNYEVASFSGTKQVILSTVSIFGVKNNFLGIAYTVVGCSCLILGTILLFSHKLYGKTLENDADIAAEISADNVPDTKGDILFQRTSRNFLSPHYRY